MGADPQALGDHRGHRALVQDREGSPPGPSSHLRCYWRWRVEEDRALSTQLPVPPSWDSSLPVPQNKTKYKIHCKMEAQNPFSKVSEPWLEETLTATAVRPRGP